MSQKEAKKVIDSLIENVIKSHSPRKALDESVHILDISYDHILQANGQKDSKNFLDSYTRFLIAVTSLAKDSSSIDKAIDAVLHNRGTQYLQKYNLLINKNFDTARKFITKVSHLIPDDEFFGISYRERSFSELKTAYKIEEGESLGPLVGKAFVSGNGSIIQVQELDQSGGSKFILNTIYSPLNTGFIALKDPDGVISVEPSSIHEGARVSLEKDTLTIVKTDKGYLPLLKRDYLSKLDLGHLFKKQTLGGRTPLGERLQTAIKYEGISPSLRKVIQEYVNELDKIHGSVDYIFHNQAAEGSLTKVGKSVGFVVLTVQYYKENNRLAVLDGRIKRDITKKLTQIAASIPGSNTIIQDTAAKIKNSIIEVLGGKPKELQQHSPVTGSVSAYIEPKLKISNQKVSAPSKVKKSTKTKSSTVKIVTSEQSFSLISLQNLINSHLQSVIAANMGDGGQRNVLNYRTGRFAGSAKVEKMSQSREGMITAFYSYMKNPYQTFEPGFRQGSPKTRDPKLLIAKSIREIAETRVANRMRAVVV
jgi:hypothetical protein